MPLCKTVQPWILKGLFYFRIYYRHHNRRFYRFVPYHRRRGGIPLAQPPWGYPQSPVHPASPSRFIPSPPHPRSRRDQLSLRQYPKIPANERYSRPKRRAAIRHPAEWEYLQSRRARDTGIRAAVPSWEWEKGITIGNILIPPGFPRRDFVRVGDDLLGPR